MTITDRKSLGERETGGHLVLLHDEGLMEAKLWLFRPTKSLAQLSTVGSTQGTHLQPEMQNQLVQAERGPYRNFTWFKWLKAWRWQTFNIPSHSGPCCFVFLINSFQMLGFWGITTSSVHQEEPQRLEGEVEKSSTPGTGPTGIIPKKGFGASESWVIPWALPHNKAGR